MTSDDAGAPTGASPAGAAAATFAGPTPGPTPGLEPRLCARAVSKTYGATTVLRNAHLDVMPGEIHALIGQNGSGKSTFVKILTAYHPADDGMELSVAGRALALPLRWRDAQRAGVSVVHQDMGLLDHLSISENVGVGGFVRSRITGRIDWKAQDEVARRTLRRLGLELDPRTPVGALPASHRAAVAIARALKDAEAGDGLLILDEATRALPREELTRFHDVLAAIASTGTAVLMVSHNLEEVLALADRVTVLRDGSVVAAGAATSQLTEADLARLMLGASVRTVQRRREKRDETGASRLTDVLLGACEPLDLTVAAGEVVGVTGLPGTGFEDLPARLAGARRGGGAVTTPRGRVDLARATVRRSLAAGIAVVPERRIVDGLALQMSVRENVALPLLHRRSRPWFAPRAWQADLTARAVDRLGIKTRSGHSLVRELSGGNQQKVLFAKWTSVDPCLLVLHEPTQAVDVGARADLLEAVDDVARAGAAVLLVSTEPTDLVEVCDRILVLHPGREARELITDDPDDVLEAIYGGSHV